YEQVTKITRSGTATSPVVVEPDVGHDPILRNGDIANGGETAVFYIQGASYVTVRHLTFDGNGVEPSVAIRVSPAGADVHGNQIIGNTFRNWGGFESDSTNQPPVMVTGGWSEVASADPVPVDTLVKRNRFEANRGPMSIFDMRTQGTRIEAN